MDCLFCDIISRKRSAYFIYEDQNFVAILDKYPIDDGHSLVLTKKHYEKITDMPEDEVGKLFSKIPKIARLIIDTTKADGFTLAQNNGKAAKQIIPHVHVHIIPRYKSKGSIWAKREIISDDKLQSLSEKIKTNKN